MENDELVRRTRGEIERQIDDFFVFEVDRNPVACAALHLYPAGKQGGAGVRLRRSPVRESGHRRQADATTPRARHGRRVSRNCSACRRRRSTISSRRAASYAGTPDDLPPVRRERYRRSGRRSLVLKKRLV